MSKILLTSYEVNALSVIVQQKNVLPKQFIMDHILFDDDIGLQCHKLILALYGGEHYNDLNRSEKKIVDAYNNWSKL